MALKIFRYGQFPRVNQFDVESNLSGLEEKFCVYQKEGLADALRERLDELPQYRTKWMPEILHLLLELSDRPVKNTSLADVESLKPPDVFVEKTWKWSELVKEEPLLRDKIWKNINYAVESSEDESWSEDEEEEQSVAETTESSMEDYTARPEELALPISTLELEDLKGDQFWKKTKPRPANIVDAYFDKPAPVAMSELQAIRETLFMLRGLSTSIYSNELTVSCRDGISLPEETLFEKTIIKPVDGFSLSSLSTDALYHNLSLFAGFGATVAFLRTWKPVHDRDPLMRRIHQKISKHVQVFDAFLTALESKYQEPKQDVVVSLAEIETEVKAQMPLYQHLERLILGNQKWIPYRWLEALHTSTILSQASANNFLYTQMGRLFFDCLAVYLRPLRKWMEDGELTPDFFIKQSKESEGESKLSQWERYTVELDEDGKVKGTPRFLQVAVQRILTSGKSVVVLKKLNRYDAMRAGWSTKEPPLTFDSVCSNDITGLMPFEELFDEAFSKWVTAKHHTTSSMLRQCLFEECGLATSLDALEKIYFLSDGATSTVLADSIFARLNKAKNAWNDSFTLTELMRETVGLTEGVVSENLRFSTTPISADVDTARRTVKSLASIQVVYRLPWAVSLIVRPATLSTYRKIFTLLLQIRRASSALTSGPLLSTSEPAGYYLVRQKLLWFTSTLYNYLTFMVLVPNIKTMRRGLAEADDVDKMLASHNLFIKRLHDQLLLGKRLELIHKTALQVLDLAIALKDSRGRAADPDVPVKESKREERDSEFESSEDEDRYDKDELMSALPPRPEMRYEETLQHLNKEYDRLSHFITAGLRGVARTGKEGMWDVLAEMLEGGRRDGMRV